MRLTLNLAVCVASLTGPDWIVVNLVRLSHTAASFVSCAQQGIQERTFTRWINEHVKRRGLFVENMAKDLKNGIIMCNLLEASSFVVRHELTVLAQVISGKTIVFHKHPRVPAQQVENCSIAVNFVRKEGEAACLIVTFSNWMPAQA